MFTNQQVKDLAALPETAFKFKEQIDSLVEFYKWLRPKMTTKAIAEFREEHFLDCRSKEGKARFAWLAAKEIAVTPLSSDPKPVQKVTKEPAKEVQVSKILCEAIALLPPVPPTNGLEKAPGWVAMGSPIYYDELIRNYRILLKKWHPDHNGCSVESIERTRVIRKLFNNLKPNWFTKYSPLIPFEKLGEANYKLAMDKEVGFVPESFWE